MNDRGCFAEIVRRSVDDALRYRYDLLMETLGALDEVIWLRDLAEERLLFVSPGFARLWGRPTADLLASPKLWIESIHPEDRDRVLHGAVTGARDGKHAMTYRIVRPDGEVRRVRDRAYPIADASGKIRRLAGVVEDVSGSAHS